jgi:hypothetical protein
VALSAGAAVDTQYLQRQLSADAAATAGFCPEKLTEKTMKLLNWFGIGILAMGVGAGLAPIPAGAEAAQAPQAARDGQHDFDFNIGTWKTHIKRILDPFSGGSHFVELNGTVTVRKVWDGRAQLEEIEADGPNGHWQGMTLFLYNPEAHQWNQTFANSSSGVLNPPLIGEFKEGRGELFASDTYKDRTILVRGVWSSIQPNSHHFEESYSDDGGKTWAPAFIAELTRLKP